MTKAPDNPRIFHITHVDNLAGILAEGGLWSDAQCLARSLVTTNIGHRHIKQRRMGRPVVTRAGGSPGDYVPFNFCSRSVMLYPISRGHGDYDGGQERIVHLVSDVQTAVALGRAWAFSDRHAELGHALHYDDLGRLDEVRWDVMGLTYWQDVGADLLARREGRAPGGIPGPRVLSLDGGARDRRDEPGNRSPGGGCHRKLCAPAARDNPARMALLGVVVTERGQGNLLRAEVDALVNTVNTVGVMGKGLALQFKKAFPEAFREYERACEAGELEPGRMHVVQRLAAPRFIINFPTKKHWRQRSRLEYVRDGLEDLVAKVRELGIESIAIPPLGCGNGGLDWQQVRPLIVEAFEALPEVRVVLFEPGGAPAASEVIDRRAKPSMTPTRAAVLALMGRYLSTGYDYRLSLVEVQKLAYFLQEAGEDLRLQYKAHYYGPYADHLRKALRNMEGHYTRGMGDGKNAPETPLEVLPGAIESAEALLATNPESVARLERVAELIEGFETPFGMELLGTVHWVMHHEAEPGDLDGVTARVQAWSARKRSQMKPGHIRAAWTRLRETGWIDASSDPVSALS